MKTIICTAARQDAAQLEQILHQWSRKNNIAVQAVSFQDISDCKNYFLANAPDLVIADIYLQNSLGTDLVRILRQYQKKHFSLIFVSARNSYAAESYELEADGYLLKPLAEEKLEQILNEILKNRLAEHYKRDYYKT